MTDLTCRAALAELVRLKDMDPVIDRHYRMAQSPTPFPDRTRHEAEHDRLVAIRNAAERHAWAAARSALALEAVPPRVPMEQVREWADRHDLGISSDTSLRDIFDDARTLVAQPQDTKDRT